MSYNWYFIFNKDEFEETGLVSKEYTYNLEGVGEKTVLVTKGVTLNVLYENVFMQVLFNDQNPYPNVEGGFAVYLDSANDVWIGIEIPEE